MHKVFYTLQDNIMDSLGFPASLRRQINNGVLQANKPDRRDTIWLRSVVARHSGSAMSNIAFATSAPATTVIMNFSSGIYLSWII